MKHAVNLATSGAAAFELALDYVPKASVERWRRAAATFRWESGEGKLSPTARELLDAGDELAAWLSSP